jgi:hypothetical protein
MSVMTTAQLRLASRLLTAQRRVAFSSAAGLRPRRGVGERPIPNRVAAPAVEETIEVLPMTRGKNAVMAVSLLGFCFGVTWYSMNAVGQAGAAGSDDPLSGLRQEAASAQEKQERQEKSTDEAAVMLKKFQKGDFDPDKYEELEAEENSKSKRPWWKVW